MITIARKDGLPVSFNAKDAVQVLENHILTKLSYNYKDLSFRIRFSMKSGTYSGKISVKLSKEVDFTEKFSTKSTSKGLFKWKLLCFWRQGKR